MAKKHRHIRDNARRERAIDRMEKGTPSDRVKEVIDNTLLNMGKAAKYRVGKSDDTPAKRLASAQEANAR